MEIFREYFVNKYGLNIQWENDCIIQYGHKFGCQVCKSSFAKIFYLKKAARFMCGECGKNPFVETEQKWKKSQEEWRKYFKTKEDMFAFTSKIAKVEFDEAVKTNPRPWEVGLHLSRAKHTANKYGANISGCCGLCFAMQYCFPNSTRRCSNCLYRNYIVKGEECGDGLPEQVLASFENPEFLAKVKAVDDKWEARAELKKIAGWRKHLDKCADSYLAKNPNWEKIDSDKLEEYQEKPKSIAEKCLEEQHNSRKEYQEKHQSGYLECPECECLKFAPYKATYFGRVSLYFNGVEDLLYNPAHDNITNIYICENCKTTLKFQLAQSGRLVKIKESTG